MPVWLQIMLGVCAPLIASFSAYVAYQQWRLGAYKLKHDLFERRWAVYAATHDTIVTTINGHPEDQKEKHAEFLRKSLDAAFLFPSEVTEFLAVVEKAISEVQSLERELRTVQDGSPRRQEVESTLIGKHDWLARQVPQLVPKFKKYLDLTSG